jgi:hypothetical protein
VRSIGLWAQVDNAFMPRRLRGKHPVELCPALRLDLSVQTTVDFDIAPLPEFESHKVTRPGAKASADVVPRYHQVMAIVAPAAHDDMDVWVLRVPVVDGDPFELRSKIPFGLGHEIAGERLQVRQLVGIVWGHDEAKVVAIALAPIREHAMISLVAFSVEHPAGGTVPRYSITTEIFEMGSERRSLGAVPNHPRLDHRPA